MTLRREEMRALSLIGGEATARSMPSMRKRTRNACSYGSKWMSDAPRLIASTSTLLTNLTTGASSLPVASWPRRFALVVDGTELEILQAFRIVESVDDRGARIEGLLDRAIDLLLVDQDRLDDVVGLELDLVERAKVGRIRHADEQAIAALEQRQRLVLRDQVFAYEAQRNLREIERLDIE